jgi:serine/threonine protein phosphatase PrpC
MSIALSRDQKPDEPDEQARILAAGGRIEAYQDEEGNPLGPARVWLLDEDIPGLAMSRSIGDLVAASVGVSFEPEILEYNITPEDRFIVLGSDGVFEFLSNEDVVKIVVPFWKTGDTKGACNALYKEAYNKWCIEEEVVDDITAVVIFLPYIIVLKSHVNIAFISPRKRPPRTSWWKSCSVLMT